MSFLLINDSAAFHDRCALSSVWALARIRAVIITVPNFTISKCWSLMPNMFTQRILELMFAPPPNRAYRSSNIPIMYTFLEESFIHSYLSVWVNHATMIPPITNLPCNRAGAQKSALYVLELLALYTSIIEMKHSVNSMHHTTRSPLNRFVIN